MLVVKLEDCVQFVAGDETLLRELLHPGKQPLSVRYSLAYAVVPAGSRSVPHVLATSEVYYILSGAGVMHIGEEQRAVAASDTIYIPPGAVQWIENPGETDLEFLCIVDPAWRPEDEVVITTGALTK